MTRYDGERLLVGSRTVNELRHRFIGRKVRTSRILNEHEYKAWVGDALSWLGEGPNGFDFGGEGIVDDVVRYGQLMVINVDYGMQWPIDALTTIQVVNE